MSVTDYHGRATITAEGLFLMSLIVSQINFIGSYPVDMGPYLTGCWSVVRYLSWYPITTGCFAAPDITRWIR